MQYQTVPAGLWSAQILADHDFETYSPAGYVWRDDLNKHVMLDDCSKYGLEAVGTAVYLEHPDAEILSYAYDLKDGRGPRLWCPEMPRPQELFDYIAAGGLIEAWNTGFEFLAWNIICTRLYGWPPLPLEQIRCAMAKARAFGLPGALGKAAAAIGSLQKESAVGDTVLKRYSKPRNPTKPDPRRRIRPTDPGEFAMAAQLYHYNIVDIQAEADISHRVPDLSPFELAVWQLDQKINLRGIPIDMPLVDKAITILEYMEERFNAELRHSTDGELSTYTEVAAMQRYLSTRWGVNAATLDEDAIVELFKTYPNMHSVARRVLEIRQTMSSAGVKKLYSMKRQASYDNRVRMLYMYHAPHTGRWSAGGFQPHNMKSSGPKLSYCKTCDEYFYETTLDTCRFCDGTQVEPSKEWDFDVMDSCLDLIAHPEMTPGKLHDVFKQKTLGVVAAGVRGMIRAPEGKEFVCSDYSAIEAVGLAMLAGEQWRIDVFRTHGKIYEMSASKITGVPFEEILEYRKRTGHHHPHRKHYGKVPELASGYGGWIGAWKQFGADEFMDDAEIKKNILAWRAASPAVVELWGGQWREDPVKKWSFTHEYYGLEGMAIQAVLRPGDVFTYRYISFLTWGDVLYAKLPSGRCIAYPQPRLTEGQDRRGAGSVYNLSYMLYNTNPKKGPMGWTRVQTYGGELTNNVTQAACSDIFRHGMLNTEGGGYSLVMHTHDELISEVPTGYGSIEEFERLMTTPAPWYADWPISAKGGWRGKRYRKD